MRSEAMFRLQRIIFVFFQLRGEGDRWQVTVSGSEREDEMGGECGTMGGKVNAYRF
jgi:hypothetical protein